MIVLFLLFIYVQSFVTKPIVRNSIQLSDAFNTNEQKPPNTWKLLSQAFKDKARNWFIKRAIKTGVPWHDFNRLL